MSLPALEIVTYSAREETAIAACRTRSSDSEPSFAKLKLCPRMRGFAARIRR